MDNEKEDADILNSESCRKVGGNPGEEKVCCQDTDSICQGSDVYDCLRYNHVWGVYKTQNVTEVSNELNNGEQTEKNDCRQLYFSYVKGFCL